MEFFGGEALIFTKFFRGKPIFFTDMTQFFRGECNFSQSSGERKKVKSSTGGGGEVRILNAIAHCCSHRRLLLFEFNSKPSNWYV